MLLQKLMPMLAVEEVVVVVAGRTTLLQLQSLPVAVGRSTCLGSWGTEGYNNTTPAVGA